MCVGKIASSKPVDSDKRRLWVLILEELKIETEKMWRHTEFMAGMWTINLMQSNAKRRRHQPSITN
jgi:hypothetical protein